MGEQVPLGQEAAAEVGLAQVGLRLERTDDLATLTLANPERRNAQTPAFWRALAALGTELVGSVRVVVVRAEGRSFSAGLDRRMLTAEGIPGERGFGELATATDLDETIAGFQRAFSWLRDPSLVSVAAVQGHAVGAGFQLALACDLRVVAEDALFAMREPALGLVPDLGGTQPLVELVGYSRALEICATGRWVGAEEAARTGLATVVVPSDELQDAVADLAQGLLSAPHGAVAGTKALLLGASHRSYEEQLAAERAAQAVRLRALIG